MDREGMNVMDHEVSSPELDRQQADFEAVQAVDRVTPDWRWQ